MAFSYLRSQVDHLRDRFTPVTHASTFRTTGQITPEEFLHAGDFLVYKFPSWSWSDASHPSKRVAHLPPGKQFLVTRGVPCNRRLGADFAGEDGQDETVVQDGFAAGEGGEGDEGWLRTGAMAASQEAKVRDVRTVDESGNVGERVEDEEDEIPDMEEDEEDEQEAIIKNTADGTEAPMRTYNIYITYTPYYRTPRLYLSGYLSSSEPLDPQLMMEDIVGDYKDKTVTLEDFPFFESSVKMASIHPCKHASVMKVLLDRADQALKTRMQKIKEGKAGDKVESGMEGLVDSTARLHLQDKTGHKAGVGAAGGNNGDEWEVLEEEGNQEDEVAIRVDQYLVVFLKFMASVTPGIEHDYTMGV